MGTSQPLKSIEAFRCQLQPCNSIIEGVENIAEDGRGERQDLIVRRLENFNSNVPSIKVDLLTG